MEPKENEQPKRSTFLDFVAESENQVPWDKRTPAEKIEAWKRTNEQTRKMLERSEAGRKYLKDRGI